MHTGRRSLQCQIIVGAMLLGMLSSVPARAAVFLCDEAGILAAIAAGGGPHTFACAGPTTVTTSAEIVIDNDVILDGEGNLIVDGNDTHRVFSVATGVTAELRNLTITGGFSTGNSGGIENLGTLTVVNCTVSQNRAENAGGGITSFGTLTVANSNISDNTAVGFGGGIGAGETTVTTVTNSTV